MRSLSEKEWEIPYSDRRYISRATILNWLKKYTEGGSKIEALFPAGRKDKGVPRSIDDEVLISFIALQKENMDLTIPALIKKAREKRIITNERLFPDAQVAALIQDLRNKGQFFQKFWLLMQFPLCFEPVLW